MSDDTGRIDLALRRSKHEFADRFRSLWLDQQHAIATERKLDPHEIPLRAAHEVWEAQPRRLRVPPTQEELAKLLGVATKTLYNWKQANPEWYKSALDSAKALVQEYLPDVAYATVENAINGGAQGAGDRRLIFEAGGMKPQTGVDVTSGGAPLKAYSVLAHPDLWDDDNDNPTVDPAPLANPAVAG